VNRAKTLSTHNSFNFQEHTSVLRWKKVVMVAQE